MAIWMGKIRWYTGFRVQDLVTFKSTHSKQHHHSWQTKERRIFSSPLRVSRLYHREARPLASLGQHVQIRSDMPPQNSRHLPVTEWCDMLFSGCQVVVLMGWFNGFFSPAFQSPRIVLSEAAPNFHQRKAMARCPSLSIWQMKIRGKIHDRKARKWSFSTVPHFGTNPTQKKYPSHWIASAVWTLDKNGAVPKFVRM